MGLYFHVYAGPVLICKYHMEERVSVETKTVKYTGCTNAECKHNKEKHKLGNSAKFCPQCGSPAQPIEKTETKEKRRQVRSCAGDPQYDNIFQLMIDGGFKEDTFEECWGGVNNEKLIPNCDLFYADDVDTSVKIECLECDFDIHHRNPDIKAEIAAVEKKYEKEIAYLRTRYDSVDIEWMIVTNGR